MSSSEPMSRNTCGWSKGGFAPMHMNSREPRSIAGTPGSLWKCGMPTSAIRGRLAWKSRRTIAARRGEARAAASEAGPQPGDEHHHPDAEAEGRPQQAVHRGKHERRQDPEEIRHRRGCRDPAHDPPAAGLLDSEVDEEQEQRRLPKRQHEDEAAQDLAVVACRRGMREPGFGRGRHALAPSLREGTAGPELLGDEAPYLLAEHARLRQRG